MKPHHKAIIKGAAVMLAAIIAVSALFALTWYAVSPKRYEYRVMVTPANLCAVKQFELGPCDAMLNALGAQGWRLVGATQDYSTMFFIKE